MERKQLEDLIQRLWDQGASIEIMKILEHDKQQREALLSSQEDAKRYRWLVGEAERDYVEFQDTWFECEAHLTETIDAQRLSKQR